MAVKRRSSVPAEVRGVRRRIEHWRKTRKKRSRMPEDLWAAAAGLARVYGVYPMAQALSVNYQSLKKRMGESARAGGTGFVELDPRQVVTSLDAAATVVELVDGDGAKLTIRFPGSGDVDILGLLSDFWRRGA